MQVHDTRPLAAVTGASSGIGYELARQFAEHGFDLVVTGYSEKINDAARDLRAMGAEVDASQIDLSTYDGVEEFYGRIKATGRPLAAIAINAGIGVGGDFTSQTDLRTELKLINLNVTSTVHLAKRVVRDMVEQKSGRILITASIAAQAPAPFETVYAASKAFDLSFAEGLRNELKDSGVTVTALMPGPTETNFFHRAGMDDTKVGANEKADPADVAREGYEALVAGKDHVVAGTWTTRVESVLAEIVPETVKAEFHRRQAEPGSAEK